MPEIDRLYERLKPIYRWIRGASSAADERLSILGTLLERELATGPSLSIPWRRRLWLYRRGFTSRSHALFDLDEDTYRHYVSDVQHELADGIAGRWDAVVNNKLTFYLAFGSFDEHLPALYGVLDGGRLRRSSPLMSAPSWEEAPPASALADDGRSHEGAEATDWVTRYLDEHTALVLKPIYGHGGRGVLVCRAADRDGRYSVNGEPKTAREFAALLDDLEEYLAWAFVEQADYAEELFPGSTNTLRILTMWDYETDEPFVGGVVHRIGTGESAPVDNWSRRGLSAEVNDDGELSSGAQWLPSLGEVRWYDVHPDTGARIEGTRVPNWSAVRDGILEMAREVPYLPRLGWDVVVTGDGEFVVLEANAHTATRTLQVHRPLLRDPRVRRFYEYHECV
jgi:hypothetical protein